MDKVRLDKWLWAARFFKTRSLAAQAVNGGKVHVNDARVKPSKMLLPGMLLNIRRGREEQTVTIMALADKRGPAKIACTLYEETPESLLEREQKRTEWKMQTEYLAPATRPNKKQRRHIIRFKQSAP